ncbi:hypothetical protein D3C86_985550 [compost metagenome]
MTNVETEKSEIARVLAAVRDCMDISGGKGLNAGAAAMTSWREAPDGWRTIAPWDGSLPFFLSGDSIA